MRARLHVDTAVTAAAAGAPAGGYVGALRVPCRPSTSRPTAAR
jgi:hypothetical protein